MRLSEAKIKEALLHPEKLVRQEALHYFADSFSRDTEVMPLAIQALAKYGRQNAFQFIHPLAELAQTESTVDWAIRELHRDEESAYDCDVYFPALGRLLCNADPHLVAPREAQIIEAPGFDEDLLEELHNLGEILPWDAERCWQELQLLAEDGAREGEVDWRYVDGVVKVLASRAEAFQGRILEILAQTVEESDETASSWMEIFLVSLAGEMRLEPAAPLVVQKLHTLGEVLSEDCVDALGKIGTDAAAEAVAERWAEAPWEYRLSAANALDKIHADASVRKLLELTPLDKDIDIKTYLAYALVGQFADEAIEPVRNLIQREEFDPTCCDLPRRLVAVSTVLGVTFPEYALWKEEAEARVATLERRMKGLQTEFQFPPASARPQERAKPAFPKEAPFVRTDQKVGRNDPCPCGSGKKFKKCCMKRAEG